MVNQVSQGQTKEVKKHEIFLIEILLTLLENIPFTRLANSFTNIVQHIPYVL